VKMEYMQKHCLHLLRYFLLKPCIATADLCSCLMLICCNGNLDCAVETWPHSHIIIQKQRILLYIVGRRPTHWRSAFQNAADEFKDRVNILQSDYNSWFFSWLDKPLWWMQCKTGTKICQMPHSPKWAVLLWSKLITVTVLLYVCLTCHVRIRTDRQIIVSLPLASYSSQVTPPCENYLGLKTSDT
jgi:hypothetical protein